MSRSAQVRLWLARLAAPAALLLAATVAIMLIRSALDAGDAAQTTTTPTTTAAATQPAATNPSTPPPAASTVKQQAQFYRVQAGDTLESIADQYGTTVEELLTLNPDVDPVELSIGQRLRVQ